MCHVLRGILSSKREFRTGNDGASSQEKGNDQRSIIYQNYLNIPFTSPEKTYSIPIKPFIFLWFGLRVEFGLRFEQTHAVWAKQSFDAEDGRGQQQHSPKIIGQFGLICDVLGFSDDDDDDDVGDFGFV